MSWLSKLVGAGVAEPVKALGEVADELFTSDDERLSHDEVMERIRNEPKLAQILNNQLDAKSRNPFQAGWRPAIGWVCALALFNYFLLNPWIQWLSCMIADECIDGPTIEIAQIIGLVTSLLGLGWLRTEEKKAGVSK